MEKAYGSKGAKDDKARRPEPVVPLFSQLHNNKARRNHGFFFHKAKDALDQLAPEFKNRPAVLISDREFNPEDIKTNLGQNVNSAFCWNHLHQNMKRQARDRLKMTTEETREATSALHRLLRQKSLDDYKRVRDGMFDEKRDENGELVPGVSG